MESRTQGNSTRPDTGRTRKEDFHPESILVVLNRKAGSVTSEQMEQKILDAFSRYDVKPKIVILQNEGTVDEVRAAVEERIDMIVPAGGDGTVKMVVEQIRGKEIALGILPLGTINHLARNAGVPLDFEEAIDTMMTGRTQAIDIGLVDGQPFITDCVIGMFAHAMFAAEKQRGKSGSNKGKRVIRLFTMMMKIFLRFPLRYFEILSDNVSIHSQSAYLGVSVDRMETDALNFGSRRDLQQGKLYLYYPKTTTRKELMRTILLAMIGKFSRIDHMATGAYEHFTVKTDTERVMIAVDGEFSVFHSPVKFEVGPGALHLRVPREKPEES